MADISHLKVGQNDYDIKDDVARQEIDGAKVSATYTSGTETLEIKFEKGSVS